MLGETEQKSWQISSWKFTGTKIHVRMSITTLNNVQYGSINNEYKSTMTQA